MTFRFVNNIWKEIKLEISPLFNSLTEVSELLWTIISEVYHVQLCSRACCRSCTENHATSVDLQTCVGRCCLQTVWHAPYSPSSPVSWLTGHSPTSHTNKLRLTDGRLSSLLSLLQPINAGTQELHLPITWKLFQHSIGVGQKIFLDTWKKYFSDCYKKLLTFLLNKLEIPEEYY